MDYKIGNCAHSKSAEIVKQSSYSTDCIYSASYMLPKLYREISINENK